MTINYKKYQDKIQESRKDSDFPRFFSPSKELKHEVPVKFKCLEIKEKDGQYGEQIFYTCLMKGEDGSEKVTIPVTVGSKDGLSGLMRTFAANEIAEGDIFWLEKEERAYKNDWGWQSSYNVSREETRNEEGDLVDEVNETFAEGEEEPEPTF